MLSQDLIDGESLGVPYRLTTWEKINRLWEREVARPGLLDAGERDLIADLREERRPLREAEIGLVEDIWERRRHYRGSR